MWAVYWTPNEMRGINRFAYYLRSVFFSRKIWAHELMKWKFLEDYSHHWFTSQLNWLVFVDDEAKEIIVCVEQCTRQLVEIVWKFERDISEKCERVCVTYEDFQWKYRKISWQFMNLWQWHWTMNMKDFWKKFWRCHCYAINRHHHWSIHLVIN